MHKTLVGVFLITWSFGFGQSNPKEIIENWRGLHPDMKIISVEEYKDLSDIDKLALSQMEDHIVYDGAFKQSDIDAYEQAVDKLIPRTDVEYIFIWKTNNSFVKIVPHSKFISLESYEQLQLMDDGALILLGEELTKADILIYEH